MNKKILLLAVALATVFYGWGQSRIAKATEQKTRFKLPSAEVQPRQEMDTLLFSAAALECGNLVTTYEAGETWGFVAGMNGFGDLEKAQRLVYNANGPYTVREVWGFFAIAKAVGDGDLRMKVYRVDAATGGPAELLGQSVDLMTSDIETDTLGVPATVFPLEDSVVISDTAFFVSLDISDLYVAEDTVALFMTNDTCGLGSDTWERFSDGATWLPINDRMSWQLNANWIMAAVVEFDETTDVDDPFVEQNNLRIFPPTPNPTSNWIDLPFQLETASPVNVEIYSANGTLVQKMTLGQKLPGNHTARLDVQTLPPGAYVYSILTEGARLMSRFVVSH